MQLGFNHQTKDINKKWAASLKLEKNIAILHSFI